MSRNRKRHVGLPGVQAAAKENIARARESWDKHKAPDDRIMTARQLATFIAARIRAQGINVDREGKDSYVLEAIAPTVNLVLLAEQILERLKVKP